MQDLEMLILADIKAAAHSLSLKEIRYLVDTYYLLQDQRKASANQTRALTTSDEPCQFIAWVSRQFNLLEKRTAQVLDYWTRSHPLSAWARSIIGIGPVIAAGLAAHIDLNPWHCAQFSQCKAKAPCSPDAPHGSVCTHRPVTTAGQVWRFAGLDPTIKWEKSQRRPWNAALKVLCWKIGESFVKVSGNPDSLYGQLYQDRKAWESARNDQGLYQDQAAAILAAKKIGKSTEAYKWYSQGKLPPGHLHARAKRYAVKLFLAHYFEQSWRLTHGTEPPLPYVIQHLGHAHLLAAEK